MKIKSVTILRYAKDIAWTGKNTSAISPMDYEKRFIKIALSKKHVYLGFVGEWVSAKTKAIILCKCRNVFSSNIGNYEKNNGCKKCATNKVANIRRKSIANVMYDILTESKNRESEDIVGFDGGYKTSAYKNLIVNCHQHGEYITSHNKYMQGRGCPKCKGTPKHDTHFVMYAVSKKVDEIGNCAIIGFDGGYIKNNTRNLIIECFIHGNYKTSYDRFCRLGRGCPECSKINATQSRKISEEDAINLAKEIAHKIGLSVVGFIEGYKNINTKNLVVRCHHHGEYVTSLNSIKYAKFGCIKCAGVSLKTEEDAIHDIIKEANNRDNITFVCFESGYQGGRVKNLKLMCSTCGEYTTYAQNFLSGKGCPNCADYGFRPNKKGVLYIQKIIENSFLVGVKFGITNKTSQERMKQQSRVSKFDHEIFYELTLQDGQKILELENKIKEAMKGKTSYISKEDMPDGYTETVAPSELSTIMYIVKSFEKELTA